MRGRVIILLFATFIATGASAAPGKHHKDNTPKVNRHDPAFQAGYLDGWRQGSNDAEALALAYTDESGPVYQQASDGYTPQYGDKTVYQKLFRQGYIEGYKSGWDYNAGQYNSSGAPSGGGSGG